MSDEADWTIIVLMPAELARPEQCVDIPSLAAEALVRLHANTAATRYREQAMGDTNYKLAWLKGGEFVLSDELLRRLGSPGRGGSASAGSLAAKGLAAVKARITELQQKLLPGSAAQREPPRKAERPPLVHTRSRSRSRGIEM